MTREKILISSYLLLLKRINESRVKMTREKILISSYLFLSDEMKFQIFVFSSSTEQYHVIRGNPT